MAQEWSCGEYTISSDVRRLDLDVIHGFLVASYWAEGRPRRVVQSIEHSVPSGLYHRKEQVGFARVVTDYVGMACIGSSGLASPPNVFLMERVDLDSDRQT